jgi:hypothetical protein
MATATRCQRCLSLSEQHQRRPDSRGRHRREEGGGESDQHVCVVGGGGACAEWKEKG